MIRKYWSLVLFVVFFAGCSLLVIRQFVVNQSRHVELREAFILLHSKGYEKEANRLYQRLLAGIGDLSNALMWSDYQRTLTLINPAHDETNNLIWLYHWTVSNELEKRSESNLEKALKLAREQ